MVQRCGLAANTEPVCLSSVTHRTPIIALMCSFWIGASFFLSHCTLRCLIPCETCWNLRQRSWISVHHYGLCSVPLNYLVLLAQTVGKQHRDLTMSSQVIFETCGVAMCEGGGRFPSVLRLGKTLVLDEKPPVPLIILVMINKAFHLVITTLNSSFGEPFGVPEKGLRISG